MELWGYRYALKLPREDNCCNGQKGDGQTKTRYSLEVASCPEITQYHLLQWSLKEFFLWKVRLAFAFFVIFFMYTMYACVCTKFTKHIYLFSYWVDFLSFVDERFFWDTLYVYIVLRAGLLLPRTKVGTAHASNSTFELILWNRKLVSFNLTWLNKLKVLSLVNSSRNGAFQPGWRSNMTCKIWWKTWVELRRTKPVNSSKI